jgi:hypothetical protein
MRPIPSLGSIQPIGQLSGAKLPLRAYVERGELSGNQGAAFGLPCLSQRQAAGRAGAAGRLPATASCCRVSDPKLGAMFPLSEEDRPSAMVHRGGGI